MNENETVADIVAEMRHGFDKSWHEIDREWAHGLPDRLEAAARRERGNAEQMREALCEILYVSEKYMKNCPHISVMIHTGISAKCRTALAAPPKPLRNCDRYANWYDAHQAWERLPKNKLGYFVQENGVECCENAWLFAPAEKQKGVSDEK